MQIAFESKSIISGFNQTVQQLGRVSRMTPALYSSIEGRLLLFKASSEASIMTEHSLWRFSRALHRAINERRLEDLEDLIDDDVDWAIYGPIDMFPFLGARHGKTAVMEVIRQIADNV